MWNVNISVYIYIYSLLSFLLFCKQFRPICFLNFVFPSLSTCDAQVLLGTYWELQGTLTEGGKSIRSRPNTEDRSLLISVLTIHLIFESGFQYMDSFPSLTPVMVAITAFVEPKACLPPPAKPWRRHGSTLLVPSPGSSANFTGLLPNAKQGNPIKWHSGVGQSGERLRKVNDDWKDSVVWRIPRKVGLQHVRCSLFDWRLTGIVFYPTLTETAVLQELSVCYWTYLQESGLVASQTACKHHIDSHLPDPCLSILYFHSGKELGEMRRECVCRQRVNETDLHPASRDGIESDRVPRDWLVGAHYEFWSDAFYAHGLIWPWRDELWKLV